MAQALWFVKLWIVIFGGVYLAELLRHSLLDGIICARDNGAAAWTPADPIRVVIEFCVSHNSTAANRFSHILPLCAALLFKQGLGYIPLITFFFSKKE